MQLNPGMLDEEVVTPEGGLCTIKDCCIVLCEESATPNPGRGAFTDRSVIDPAFDRVCKSVEKAYGLTNAERVAEVLYALPIVYNGRLSRAIGRAKFITNMGIAKATVIELTGSVDIPGDYMPGLLVHEGCHVAHCVLAGGAFAYEEAHGSRWRELMIGAGMPGEARCSDPRLLGNERVRKGGPEVALTSTELQLGEVVSFMAKRQKIVAKIIQKTERGAIVQNEQGRWRVSYGLIRKETT